VSLNSQPLSAFVDKGLDMGAYFAGFFTDGQLPLNALAGAPAWTVYWCDNYLRRGHLQPYGFALLLTVCSFRQYMTI
jgi:hypothetical protein